MIVSDEAGHDAVSGKDRQWAKTPAIVIFMELISGQNTDIGD